MTDTTTTAQTHHRAAPQLWPYFADNGDVEVYDYDRLALEQQLRRPPVHVHHD